MMELKFLFLVISIVATPIVVEGANILFFFASSGYSHRISAWPIVEKLADSGHSVTFLSPYPAKSSKPHPNITDYVPKDLAKDLGYIDMDFIGIRLKEGVTAIENLWFQYSEMGVRTCGLLLKKKEFVEWVDKSSFDLVIVNSLFNDCGYGLVHKFKAKHIMHSSSAPMMYFQDAFGYADENVPGMQYHFPVNMTFFQSVKNSLSTLYWHYMRHTQIFPEVEKMIREGLNITSLPPLEEIERNTSVIFTYTHTSEDYPRSLPPNVVGIGGIHCNDDRKQLPKDLEEFISSGEDGFILLSFGTYAAISSLPLNLQAIFFGAMSKFPNIRFLVKFNGEPPENFPKNAKAVQWIPQQDAMANSKIRAFIGHGGLLGTHEAIYHAVPMIFIPLFVEQDYQATRAHGRETSIALELTELTEEILSNAINGILNNPKYKENTMKLSKLFRDRPWKPLDAAIWWIEYALRNDDLSHLRPIGINKTWYERRMLHIWGFIALCILTVGILASFILYFIINVLIRVIFATKPKLD